MKPTGIKVTIEINCETEQEILAHLSVLRSRIKSYIKKHESFSGDPVKFFDSNCYGDHKATVKEVFN